jgi:hypothetical protein
MKKKSPRPFSITIDVTTLNLLNKITISTHKTADAVMFAALTVYEVYLGQGNAFMASRKETSKRGGKPKPLSLLVENFLTKVKPKEDDDVS